MRKYLFFGIAIWLVLSAGIASAQRLTVNVPTANIRSGPGTKYKVLWKVEKYHPIQVIKKSASWYYFRDFEGDKGWMFEKIVGKFPSVIVLRDKCNVRSGPGTNHKVVFRVDKGVPFRELKRKGDWIHLQHSDGDKGWIHKKLVW